MQRKHIPGRRHAQWRIPLLTAVMALIGVTLALPVVAQGATRTWTGPAGGDWFDAGHWDPDDAYPQAGDTILIGPPAEWIDRMLVQGGDSYSKPGADGTKIFAYQAGTVFRIR